LPSSSRGLWLIILLIMLAYGFGQRLGLCFGQQNSRQRIGWDDEAGSERDRTQNTLHYALDDVDDE
jgi:hypothetical protein